MSSELLVTLLQRVIDAEARKDSLEFGPAGGRIKVYINAADEAGAARYIQTMINLKLLADTATPQPLHRKQQGAEAPPDVVSGTSEEGRGA